MVNPARTAVCIFILALSSQAFGVENDTGAAVSWHGCLTIADVPFNVSHGGQWPSMEESRSIASSFFELTGAGIGWTADRVHSPLGKLGSIAALEAGVVLVSLYLPGGETWMHEEYHRAVLSNRGITSYNTLYDFNVDISDVSVTHVSDDALVQLKAEHPEELVRLESAGYEAQSDLADALLQDAFFNRCRFMEIPSLYTLISNTVYLAYCTTPAADAETREFNSRETSIDERDAIGWDYTAWTYDLHRPDEPYAARGPHPSGIGINRYILWTDLTPAEQHYLRLQAGLSLLNLVRPQLYWLPDLHWGLSGTPIDATAGLEHQLTPFGFAVGLRAFTRAGDIGIIGAISAYSNERMALPGIDCAVLDIPIFKSTRRLFWSPRIALWLQPKDLRFSSSDALWGICTQQKLGVRLTRYFSAVVEGEAKTAGWVSGIEDLGPSARLSFGGEWSVW